MTNTDNTKKTFKNDKSSSVTSVILLKIIGNIILFLFVLLPGFIPKDNQNTYTLIIFALIICTALVWHVRNLLFNFKFNSADNIVMLSDAISFGNQRIRYSNIRFIKIKDKKISTQKIVIIYTKTAKISVHISENIFDEFIIYLNRFTENYNIQIYGKLMEISSFVKTANANTNKNLRPIVAIFLRIVLYTLILMLSKEESYVMYIYLIEGVIMPFALLYTERLYYKKILPTQGILTFRDNFLTFNDRIIYYSNIKDCTFSNNDSLLSITLNNKSKINFPTNPMVNINNITLKASSFSVLDSIKKFIDEKLGKVTENEFIDEEINEDYEDSIPEENNISMDNLNDMLSRD